MMTLPAFEFSYPTSTSELPLQRTAVQIVRALADRSWDVPGFQVKFRQAPSDDGVMRRRVSTVRTAEALIDFNGYGQVMRVVVPERDLHIWWGDRPSVHLHVYTGLPLHWAGDQAAFFADSFKTTYQPHHGGAPYATYEDFCTCANVQGAIFGGIGRLVNYMSGDPNWLSGPHAHSDRWSPRLGLHSDLEPEDVVPSGTIYQTDEILREFDQWLTANVLPLALVKTQAAEPVDPFWQNLPYPSALGPLYRFVDEWTAKRIRRAVDGAESDSSGQPYGLTRGGRGSTAWLGDCGNGHDSIWDDRHCQMICGARPVEATTPIQGLVFGDLPRYRDQDYVVRITPNRADGIYVYDASWSEDIRGTTLVPATEYRGGYVAPAALVARELDLDEIEIVSGPWLAEGVVPQPTLTERLLRWLIFWR